ncbi:MAG: DUF2914 domain-containing protein [Candidatus Pacebacteria bacterium]|nr:DUF2914 domain-containing protein [Candidatus Paceibacterota bacterium]
MNWYKRYERHFSSIFLVSGFVFDAITLKRVDLFWENLWVGAHLLFAAVGIIFLNLYENRKERFSEKTKSLLHFWLIAVVQFSFGGLLSTFLVFYFRSAALAVSWPFMLFLAAAFVCNEVLKHHYTRLVFQVLLLLLSIYSFAIYIVPVAMHQIGDWVFILSGLVTFFILVIFLLCLRIISRERFVKSRKPLIFSIISVFVIVNLLYFTNLIPPIPLSLKDAGVYHSLTRVTDSTGSQGVSNYYVQGEQKSWWDYFKLIETVHQVAGQPFYLYTSIFSPTNLNTTIIHQWQYYDDVKRRWINEGSIRLPILGGREGGYRTYSERDNLAPGSWRVNVDTLSGQVIGRISFDVVNVSGADSLPALVEEKL